MATQPMPVGPINYFEGDILKQNPDAFGYFYCKIVTPVEINQPLIQTKVDSGEGLRTMAPLGTWYAWMFSQEILESSKFGYQYEIIKGYTFGKEIIFKDYVNELYEIKENSVSGSPMHKISKLLLNSLFGKMGMRSEFNKVKVINSNSLHDCFTDSNVWDVIDLNNGKTIVFYSPNSIDYNTDDKYSGPDTNVAIASSITAYGRIHMYEYLVDPSYKIIYMDTDGVITVKVVRTSGALGAVKKENTFEEVWSLGPKFYGGITTSGKAIIKAKGYNGSIDIKLLNKLLVKDSLIKLPMNKLYKNLIGGLITSKDMEFSMRATDLKRKPIFDENNNLVDTIPYIININKKIINK